jgi:4a-hydroxytetrahydrobiopterin dehydratase
MSERITPAEFLAAAPTQDWGVEGDVARATFRTGTFEMGVRFVMAIGELADAADHHPDVDLRYPTVTVRLTTHDVNGLSYLDVQLAREISLEAQALGVAAVPPVGRAAE